MTTKHEVFQALPQAETMTCARWDCGIVNLSVRAGFSAEDRADTTSEARIQAAALQHWLVRGVPGSLVAALPNMGAMGQTGLTKGVPDLLVLGGNVGIGFAELKRSTGKPSPEQLDFQALCVVAGVPCEFAYGLGEVLALLERWGVILPAIDPAAAAKASADFAARQPLVTADQAAQLLGLKSGEVLQ